jgi:hypothetical protein
VTTRRARQVHTRGCAGDVRRPADFEFDYRRVRVDNDVELNVAVGDPVADFAAGRTGLQNATKAGWRRRLATGILDA